MQLSLMYEMLRSTLTDLGSFTTFLWCNLSTSLLFTHAGDVQAALHNVGDRLSASFQPVRDAPLLNFGIGASFELDKGAVQPIVSQLWLCAALCLLIKTPACASSVYMVCMRRSWVLGWQLRVVTDKASMDDKHAEILF